MAAVGALSDTIRRRCFSAAAPQQFVGNMNHFWLCVTAWQTSVGGINENQFLTLYSNASLQQGVWGDDDRVSDFFLHTESAVRPSALPKDSAAQQSSVCYSLASTRPVFVLINRFFLSRTIGGTVTDQRVLAHPRHCLLLNPQWNSLWLQTKMTKQIMMITKPIVHT